MVIPPLPLARGPLQDGGAAQLWLRYEDVAQDGRILLHAMVQGMSPAVWRPLISRQPAFEAFRRQGILPILSRIVLTGDRRPVSTEVPVRFEGAFRLAREKNGERLFLNTWLDCFAPVATTMGEAPAEDALQERVGRAYAEHIFTRPFAAAGERRVTLEQVKELAPLFDESHESLTADQLGAGLPFEEQPEISFGQVHTDSNQHVNSLVYPRLFQEAAVRFHDLKNTPGASGLLASKIDIRYRKPFFAGDRGKMLLHGDRALHGRFTDAHGKLHTSISMQLEPSL